ncbi:FAD binding domain-containing protein [Variovorax paradoxus]|uniref:FAD binding domain-containing protein n=1 Tax=Variovorax paradoxus TaxID=34073 RepID=UPI0027833F78|nr:xanthine dehydrogenase family protein subunit M [Variovorax paradoxus]MDP9932801.1 carbon-monoxide dehydrogenase medium subunit [Variovorax paradoxus]
MFVQAFEYCRVRTASDASALLREHPSAKLLAGGQSLLASMRMGLLTTEMLVDLQDVAELHSCQLLPGASLELGAMRTHGAIATDGAVREFSPGLAALAGDIADSQVRNMGTIGGSLANADPSACWAAGALALDAEITTSRRTLHIDDFFTGLFGTALEPDEVLTKVRFRRPRRFAYLKHEQSASRFAMVGVAVADFGDHVRVAVNGTFEGAVRVPQFEQALQTRFDAEALANAALPADLMPTDIHAGADYRAHLATVLCKRVVCKMNEGDAP